MNETTLAEEHLTATMTTALFTDVTEIRNERGVSASNSDVIRLRVYFMWLVAALGIVGTLTNALVLYAMVVAKQHKKQLLIFNQNLLDAFSCLWMVTACSVSLANVRLSGLAGYLLRSFTQSESIMLFGTTGSKICLMAIAVERYLKVVHPTGSKKRLRKWMIYVAAASAWVIGLTKDLAVKLATAPAALGSRSRPRSCRVRSDCSGAAREHPADGLVSFVSFFILPLITFLFCYGRILVAIRRQARIMASHTGSAPITTNESHASKIQTNVVKTMIFVCALFAITNAPLHFYLVGRLFNLGRAVAVYYALLFLSIAYNCINPFIYGFKFIPVFLQYCDAVGRIFDP